MISVRLYGGLGNQMFQIAATIAASLKYNIPYCIPKHTLNDNVWKPYHFENVNYCDDNNVIAVQKVWKEPSHSYHEIPMPIGSIVLDGYFQTIKYFENYLPEIRKALGFNLLPTNYDTISIHIRRGDYLNHPTKHPVVTFDYIKKAIEYFEGDYDFIIFSDDIEWCKKNLNDEFFGPHNFDYAEKEDSVNDMKYMAMAEHNIIANSTYSLMASILNNNPNKICVAPSIWFGEGNKNLDQKDIVPGNYIRI